MENFKYNSIHNIFIKWVNSNLIFKKYSFSKIRDSFFLNKEIKLLDEYFQFANDSDLDVIIMEWISKLVEDKILIKEVCNNQILFSYNKEKINETQRKIIKQNSQNRKMTIIGITILIIFILAGFISDEVKKENDRKLLLQQKYEEEKRIAEELVKNLAEEYNMNDIEYDHFENSSVYCFVCYNSEQFENLSDEDKLLFITSLEEENLHKEIFNDLQFCVKITSNGHTYHNFTTDGMSWLERNNKSIFSMSTPYAKKLQEEESIKDDSYSDSNTNNYYSVQRNYSGCYPSKPHYVCYEKGRCRCVPYI